jgi:hypothetical protein
MGVPAEQPATPGPHERLRVEGDVQELDLGVRRQEGRGGIHRRLPRPLADPDDRTHAAAHPPTCSPAQSSTTATTTHAGTVSSPSRMNSDSDVPSSSPRSTRRQSSVASDPV